MTLDKCNQCPNFHYVNQNQPWISSLPHPCADCGCGIRYFDKENLLSELKRLKEERDHEVAHVDADEALLKFINDDEVSKAFYEIEKWYA